VKLNKNLENLQLYNQALLFAGETYLILPIAFAALILIFFQLFSEPLAAP